MALPPQFENHSRKVVKLQRGKVSQSRHELPYVHNTDTLVGVTARTSNK